MLLHLDSFIFGFSQGFVVGPITLFGIQEGLNLQRGFYYQAQVILGSIVVDILYLFLAAYGAATFIEFPMVKLVMWATSAYMLIHMGINSYHQSKSRISLHHMHRHKLKFYETDFVKAVLINLVNPLAIIFWVMVAASLYSQAVNEVSPFIFASNILVGCAISSFFVAFLTMAVRHSFHKWMLKRLMQLGSAVLVGYGLYFSFKAVMELHPLVLALLA